MSRIFDLVVIGTGSAASTVASTCRAAGWEVAIIDSRPFGGTCALRGCDPKKVLVGAADVVDWIRRMEGKGIRSENTRVDWPELIRFKCSFTDPVPDSVEASFAKAGIARFHGRAHFISHNAVQVAGERLEARFLVIGTGARPRRLNIPGEELLTPSDKFLELDSLPPHLVFLGGGYVSLEFALVSMRAGAHVTILHRGERLLQGFDPDLVANLTQKTRSLGADIRLHTEVRTIEKLGERLIVYYGSDCL